MLHRRLHRLQSAKGLGCITRAVTLHAGGEHSGCVVGQTEAIQKRRLEEINAIVPEADFCKGMSDLNDR